MRTPSINSKCSYRPETPNLGKNWQFFLSHVTLKFDILPWKTIGHLFYATLLFVFHFIAFCEIKMKLQSWKNKFWSKSANFCPVWPWNLTMTFKNNRAPLLCYFKLFTSFHSHLWIQNGVSVRKRSIWVKIGDILSRMTLKCDGWPWKTIGRLFYATSSFMHHFIAIREFKLETQGWGKVLFEGLESNTSTFSYLQVQVQVLRVLRRHQVHQLLFQSSTSQVQVLW